MPQNFRRVSAVAALVAATFAMLPIDSASADTLRHRPTGFAASAPRDFTAAFHRPSASYVVASHRRDVAIRYQRLRTRRSPGVVASILAGTLRGRVARQRVGRRRAARVVLASGLVLRVRRSGPRAVEVTRFDRRSWSGQRRLLSRIRRSIRGGRFGRLARRQPSARRGRTSTPGPGSVRDLRGKDRRQQRPRDDSSGGDAPAAGDSTAPTGGDVLFRSDFESGDFEDWYVQSLRARATIVSPGAFGSDHAARFEVRDGDVEPDTGSERSEVSGPTVDEGQDLYFRDSFRVPGGSSIGTSWLIINQLHEHDWGGSPGIAVFLGDGPELRIGAGDGSPTFVDDVPIDFDRWHDLVYRVNLSQDPDVGFIEVWLDGNRLELDNGQTRIYGQTLQADSAYLKAGIYRGRSSTGTTVIEHDNLTIATTLEAAMAGR
jgi:hypothetical protein